MDLDLNLEFNLRFSLILFSGSLYAYVFTHIKWLVFITPIGGFGLIIGWGFLLFSYLAKKDYPPPIN